MVRNRSRAGTGTGPFFGELTHLTTHTLAENTDLSPSLPVRERLHRGLLERGGAARQRRHLAGPEFAHALTASRPA